MAVFLSERWRRQPPFAVALDRRQRLANGLAHLFSPLGGRPIDWTADQWPSAALGSGVAIAPDPAQGNVFTFSGSQNGTSLYYADRQAMYNPPGMTFYARVKPATVTGSHFYLAEWDEGSTYVYLFGQNNDKIRCYIYGTGVLPESTASVSIGSWYDVAITCDANTHYVFYVNNAAPEAQTQGSAGTVYWHMNPRVGVDASGGNTNYGSIAMVAAWRRVLAPAEVGELFANPWQLFARRRNVAYFFGAAAGGTTYNDGVTEGSATAADTTSATKVTAASVGEGSATGADTPSSTATFAASAAEGSATAAETVNGTLGGGTYSVSVAEGSATTADTPSAVATLPASDTEGSATSADTVAATQVTARSVAEGSATAADSTDADKQGQSSGTVAEGSATATDTTSAIATLTAAAAEGSATATDSPVGGIIVAASVAEGSATALDTSNFGAATISAGVTEGSATAASTQSAVVVYAGSVAEGTATAADTAAATALWAAFVAEGSATAADFCSTSGLPKNVSVAEGSATATDTVWDCNPPGSFGPPRTLDPSAVRIGSATVDGENERLGSPVVTPAGRRL